MKVSGCSLVLAAVSLAGCDDAAKKPVQAKIPAAVPSTKPQQPEVAQVGTLPLRKLPTESIVSLRAPTPGGIGYLVERVKEKFASGEANYQAGHLEAARRATSLPERRYLAAQATRLEAAARQAG